MYLNRFELLTTQTMADAFYFHKAQECEQVFHRPSDLAPNTGQWGSFPALGDRNPTQKLSVRATLRVPYGETVNRILIDSWDDMTAVLDRMFYVLNAGMGKLYATREDGENVWAYAKPSSVRRASYPDQRRLVQADVTFELPEGHWYGEQLVGGWSFDDGYYFDSGLYFDSRAAFELADDDTFQIIYDGNAIARIMTITIDTLSGTVTDPKIANANTDQFVQWTGTVGASTLTINTGAMSVVHGSSDEYDNLSIDTDQFEWMTLRPHTLNLFTFTETGGGTAAVEFRLYPHYAPA